ncbi:hypothetical protein BCR34DRAFT_3399 [Clohesyomyces aquaticus]|uniref:Enoyl reductase (ER) domain-containing protein n=1 Tax=Clohesyomyces aquaticus TaxID=1231657 RepID=A0A1Y2ABX2_9PLEO|nr:hypothetical protein BCR34DRAFT_3399 [Clohesyomyces aquaticus]
MASSPIPATMKAWTYSRPGPHRKILELKKVPTPPLPTGSQLLFKVAFAGIDPSNTNVMKILPSLLVRKNAIPGNEFSGTIMARGPDAPSHFKVGCKVLCVTPSNVILRGRGPFCEYICLDSKTCAIALVPEGLTMEEASCIGQCGMMAMLIHKHGKLHQGNGYRILVNGASGGCGSMFVQAAVALGAKEVVGVCSAPNAEFVLGLGASKIIDYRANAPLHEYLAKEYQTRPFDFVLDTIGAQVLYTKSPGYLKEEGAFLNIGSYAHGMLWTLLYAMLNMFRPWWLGGTPRKFVIFSPQPEKECMVRLMNLVREGKIKVHIEKVFAFEELCDALDLGDTKRVRGKMVLTVGGD